MRPQLTVSLVALLPFLGQTSAFFRLPCERPIVVGRADPITHNGGLAHHVHSVMGGSGFNLATDFNALRNSKCSTCRVKEDNSAYWIPTLYHRNKDGSFTSVRQAGGATIYYLQRGNEEDGPITAFPDGFRMIAGDKNLRTFTRTREQRAISYACLGRNGPETHEFPKQNCPQNMRAQINFPYCWDGKNIDSPDHQSHVAYSSNVDSGSCPESHPVRLIHLFYEIHFVTQDYADEYVNGKQPEFYWSMGDPTGYGFHGDFFNGWDRRVLQRAIDGCTNLSGNIEDCHQVTLRRPFELDTCELDRATGLTEVVTGTIPELIVEGPVSPPLSPSPSPSPPATTTTAAVSPRAASSTTSTTSASVNPDASPKPIIVGRGRKCGKWAKNAKCGFGLCCSSKGWCGNTNRYCDRRAGLCQRNFGRCWN